MAIQTASETIYVHSPDHPKRSRIISPVAVFNVANFCWRVDLAESYIMTPTSLRPE
jgi:hypothetical protein